MPVKPYYRLFSLEPNPRHPLRRYAVYFFDRLLGLDSLEKFYRGVQGDASERPFFTKALEHLGVRWETDPEAPQKISADHPLVVVANHPFGALEGMVLAEFLRTRRSDVKVLANKILSRIPEISSDLIPVDAFGGPKAKTLNGRPIRDAFRWIHGGGALAAFPSGEVSHRRWGEAHAFDPAWSPILGRLLEKLGVAVLPVYFQGSNSSIFNILGLLHPGLRTLRLPREFLLKRNKRVRFTVGNAIPAARLARFKDGAEVARYLRFRTYLLASKKRRRQAPASWMSFKGRKTPPIASAVPQGLLEDEFARLPEENTLSSSGDLEVRLAEAHQIPAVIREIGRLRELTFRACGEGTGQPLDLDVFDHRYLHLILWDRAERQIAGSYRMGPTDRVLPQWGIRGLYTSTLFHFEDKFFRELGPALELGRSFIRLDYQRGFLPLLLLWKAIARYTSMYPRYRRLFGAVSISNEYCATSQHLMVRYLKRHCFRSDGPILARPRNPFHSDKRFMPLVEPDDAWDADPEEVSSWVADLEPDRKGMPVLLRHYLKLGAQFSGFNVDPKFNRALDGLMTVDLLRTEPTRLNRYMGVAYAREFRVRNGTTAQPV